MTLADIIIINWNAGFQLAQAVTSIAESGNGLVSSVIIVDNASDDDSLAQIESFRNPPFSLRVVRNSINVGFGAACNQAARMATSDFLLFLNPDARLFESSLSKSLSFLRDPRNCDVGVVGIQLLDELDHVTRSCARFPTLTTFVTQALGIDRLSYLSSLNMRMAEWDHNETRTVDHVIGACLLIRKSLFDSLGGFDERFFMYLEDLDLSLRVHQAGYRTVFLADAQAFHAGGGTSRAIKSRRLFYQLRSRLLYSIKHFKPRQTCLLAALTLCVEPLARTVFSLIKGRPSEVPSTWRAFCFLWLDFRSIMKTGRS